MTTELNNYVKGEYLKALLDAQTVKLILMATAFTHDKDAHDGYANVSASELANGNGYTTAGQTLTGYAVAVDDVNDRADATWNDASWTASGGSIGPSPGAIPYVDTHASDASLGYIDFGSDQTAGDGADFVVTGITCRIS